MVSSELDTCMHFPPMDSDGCQPLHQGELDDISSACESNHSDAPEAVADPSFQPLPADDVPENSHGVLPSTTLYYFVLRSTALYCFIRPNTTLYYFVLPSTTLYYCVIPSATLYYFVLPSTTLYYCVLPSTTLYYCVLPSATLY